MSIGKISRRPARRSDVIDFFGRLPSETIHGQVWEREGEILAFAGYWMMNGIAVVFSDLKPDLDVPAITIVRQTMAYLQDLDKNALCTAQDERAEAFLQRLGWEHAGTSDQGEVYAWHN